jgi:germination protein M
MLSKIKLEEDYIMKTNLKKIVIVLVIIAIIAGVITYFINKNKKPEYVEYEPQEEISDEQERKTMISLYFVNKTTRNVEPEARMLDVKTLIKDPYTVIINMLIDGPKNENHDNVIPEGTTLIGTSLEGDTLKINFSSEFVENHIGGKEEEQKTIECLVNSLTELTEVNSIKILINGEENAKFKDGEIDFSQNFIRNE